MLVSLKLTDASGALVSENFYWRGKESASYQALIRMPSVPLLVTLSKPAIIGDDHVVTATLRNTTATPALTAKLTLLDVEGKRILPALYTDNYVSLMPGESKSVVIRYPASQTAAPKIALRGWNIVPTEVK